MECGSAFKVTNNWMHTGEEKITQKDVKKPLAHSMHIIYIRYSSLLLPKEGVLSSPGKYPFGDSALWFKQWLSAALSAGQLSFRPVGSPPKDDGVTRRPVREEKKTNTYVIIRTATRANHPCLARLLTWRSAFSC